MRSRLLFLLTVGLLLALAVPAAATAITRDEVLARAKLWVEAGVAYDQGKFTGGYRQDCSGYVSMAWNLGKNYGTTTLPEVSHQITKDELLPGDVLLDNQSPDQHVLIFRAWANAAHTSYYAYEMTPPKAIAPTMDYPYWSWFAYSGYYRPFRYNGIQDSLPTPGTLYMATFASDSSLYRLNPRTHSAALVGLTGVELTDIACRGTTLFGIGFGELYRINPATGVAQSIGPLGLSDANGLVAQPVTNVLYGATESGDFFRIDAASGKTTTIGQFGNGVGSSGDLAFLDGRLFATVVRPGFADSFLAVIDLPTGTAGLIGDTGYPNLYGLTADAGVLYGATYSGDLITISTSTGVGQPLWQEGIAAGGLSSASAPTVTRLSPASGKRGATVTITGTAFGSARGTGMVRFGTKACTKYVSWTATRIKVNVPAKAAFGSLKVTVKTMGGTSNAKAFDVHR
jgi:hypothetical protein